MTILADELPDDPGTLKAMPPKLCSDDGKHVVICPLAYVEESDLEAYAELRKFPIIPCDLCGSQDNLQRRQLKAMLRDWEQRWPGRIETIFNSLARVQPSHLLDRALFDFAGLRTQDLPFPEGDIVFEEEPVAAKVIPLRR
jgi:tRNA 2-thiocytidine biosynthesis protein TtcA